MGILSGAIGVVFLIYLLLRIARMLAGTTTTVTNSSPTEHIDLRPKLPNRTEDEIDELLDARPKAWVTYNGITPPLRLLVRGMNEELYRRVMRAHLDDFGQETLDMMPMNEKMTLIQSMLPDINAKAYVLDWEGAVYPNGSPLPYTPANLAVLMRKDEMLKNFISDESARISPDWK